MNKSTALAFFCATTTALKVGLLVAQTTPPAGASPQQGSGISIFAPLTLPPAPSATRLATGVPGPKYWQNRADYDLKATLDTATHSIHGSMRLRYTNNSPDALGILWFQIEQKTEVIDRFDQLLGAKAVSLAHRPGADRYEMQVTLTEPLKPGKTATFRVDWHYSVSGDGRVGTLYETTQWYPRLNVYDDVKGWNTESYSTGAEYFLEYGDYTMEVTLPMGYIVAATGTLDNPKDVLTATEITRLAQAAHADTTIPIVTGADLANGVARLTRDGMVTWKFHAKNVRDAVWCAAPDYQWDATSWHGVLAQAYYRKVAAQAWHRAADMVRASIQEYSERWYPYPYPQASATEAPISGGMEYPMLSVDVSEGYFRTITHETGHNWFPMIVGSNERMHAWMDEGFDKFINSFSSFSTVPRDSEESHQNARIGRWVADTGDDVLETGTLIGNTIPQYYKTAQVLQVLRRDVMGPAVFDKAFRAYIQQWAYKHPTPMDFFRVMADGYGHSLDWFWRECFLEAPRFDQAIDSVRQTMEGGETHMTVAYGNKGRMVMPLLVRFTFSDSTTQDVTYPAEVWRADPASYTVSYTFPKKTVSRIVLDPETHLPDAERSNNVWMAK